MTSPAFVVLSLALVCSTIGTTSKQSADHYNKHAMLSPAGTIYEEIDNIHINMLPRTNKHNFRIRKHNISNNRSDEKQIDDRHKIFHFDQSVKQFGDEGKQIDQNVKQFDGNIKEFDDIYTEDFRDLKLNSNIVKDKAMRQYNMKDYYSKMYSRHRVKRDDDSEAKCELFSFNKNDWRIMHPHDIGTKDKHYFKNMNCVFAFNASEGEIIKLTFVDVFHIEAHAKCAYDFLEIRDGHKGYAKLLGKLCGETFPSQITTTGPSVWLKFHSDDTIEYEGFHISVQFEKRPESHSIPQSCYARLTANHGIIDSSTMTKCRDDSEGRPLEAVWTIETDSNTKIYLNFTTYSLQKPNECEENVVQVFGSILEEDSILAHYCGSVANSVTTRGGDGKNGKEERGNLMYIRMFASLTAKQSAFNATYTAFRTLDPANNKDECDEETEFDCDDNTCIAVELRCNGYANCRLKADEDAELCKGETESMISQPHIMVILVIFSLILSGMSFVFLFKCIRKLYQDHKIIKEHIRQSCEDRLDTLIDSRFTLDPKKLQRDSEPRASLERENHTNEMYKQQRNFSKRKPSSIDSDFVQETHLDLDEEIWRRDVENVPVEAQDIKIERNGRTRCSDMSKKEESMRSKKESEEPKERKEIRDASVGAPDTKESGCQTRESLFQAETAPSSDGSKGSGTNSRGFSTFGYSGATIARPSPPVAPSNTSQITIELLRQVPHQESTKSQKKIPERRPMSTETTRSAPDVIIVSKPIR